MRTWGRVAAVCLLLVGGVVALGLFVHARRALKAADPEHARRADRPIPVRTALVAQSSVQKVIGGTSVTAPSYTANIRTEASGTVGALENGAAFSPNGLRVKQVLVRYGDAVRAGQLLVELDDGGYVAAAKSWESVRNAVTKEITYRQQTLETNKQMRQLALERSHAEVKYRDINLDTQTKIREALESLSKTGAASQVNYYEARSREVAAEFEKAIAKLNATQSQIDLTNGLLRDEFDLDQAISRREQANAAIELAKRSIEACQLRSPLDGYIGKVDVVPGQVVSGSMSFMQVLKTNPIWVCMDYPQERIAELSIGQPASVVVDSFPKETFKGKVVAIMPEARTTLRVLPVYVELSNPNGRIKSGVTAFTQITVSDAAVVVPETAVMQDEHRATVFCVENGRARLRQIQTGPPAKNGLVEVASGLSPGDEVVIFGNVELRDNDPVDTNWRKWARRG